MTASDKARGLVDAFRIAMVHNAKGYAPFDVDAGPALLAHIARLEAVVEAVGKYIDKNQHSADTEQEFLDVCDVFAALDGAR